MEAQCLSSLKGIDDDGCYYFFILKTTEGSVQSQILLAFSAKYEELLHMF